MFGGGAVAKTVKALRQERPDLNRRNLDRGPPTATEGEEEGPSNYYYCAEGRKTEEAAARWSQEFRLRKRRERNNTAKATTLPSRRREDPAPLTHHQRHLGGNQWQHTHTCHPIERSHSRRPESQVHVPRIWGGAGRQKKLAFVC